MKWLSKISSLIGLALALGSCGDSSPKYEKSPVDDLIRDMHNVKSFSIILHDMDADEGMSSTYKHQYKILKDVNGEVKQEITPWKDVSERFFARNQDNMGMTIASKDSTGKINKVPAPAGYGSHIGNPKYGSWQTGSNGQSFWQFYGQYAFMRDMLGMNHYGPVYRNYYNDYHTSYRSGRPYYGPSGSAPIYGTSGSATNKAYSTSRWTQKPNTFKESVRSRVARSSTAGSRTASSSRSGSRYSTSSSRSSGGGFGK